MRTIARGADERRGGVDAGDVGQAAFVEEATEGALAAGDVEDAVGGLGLEEAEDIGEDDLALVFAAFIADELVVPVGDVGPGGGFRGRGGRGGNELPPPFWRAG